MFIVSKLFSCIFLPPGLFIILIIVSIILIINNKKKLGIYFLIITCFLLYSLSISPIKNLLLIPLEYSYPFKHIDKLNFDAIIILGGGTIGAVPDRSMKNGLTQQAFQRAYIGSLVWKKKKVPIICTGGKLFGAIESEAQTLASVLMELGVTKQYIFKEGRSKNTIENALFSRKILKQNGFKKVALITSAYHIKRSVYIFRTLKYDVIPIPTDYRTTNKNISIFSFMPNVNNLENSYTAIHEYIGILYSKIILWKYKKKEID